MLTTAAQTVATKHAEALLVPGSDFSINRRRRHQRIRRVRRG